MRDAYQVVILSDTFYEFAKPLMKQLGMPTLFCHSLEADAGASWSTTICACPTRSARAVKRFRSQLGRRRGDSYNDTAMLGEAHGGILFHPPENVIREFRNPVVRDYAGLRRDRQGPRV